MRFKANELSLSNDAYGESVRGGEKPKLWFRAGRAFQSNGAWFFSTREGIDVGPYASQFDADLEANMLGQRLTETPPDEIEEVIRSKLRDAEIAAGDLNRDALTDHAVGNGGEEILEELSRELSR